MSFDHELSLVTTPDGSPIGIRLDGTSYPPTTVRLAMQALEALAGIKATLGVAGTDLSPAEVADRVAAALSGRGVELSDAGMVRALRAYDEVVRLGQLLPVALAAAGTPGDLVREQEDLARRGSDAAWQRLRLALAPLLETPPVRVPPRDPAAGWGH